MGPKFPRIPKILLLTLLATVCIFAETLAPTRQAQASVSDDSAAQVAVVAPKLVEKSDIQPVTLLLYSQCQLGITHGTASNIQSAIDLGGRSFPQ